ncbi:MAG: type II secretion system F family protein [Frankia sp.]|nr:type II secretion system F family protein [Frankia sp.]
MAAATGVLLGGGQAGLAVPAAVAAVALLAGVLARSDPGRERRARLLGELPMALDLVAACLAAGAPVPGALATTAAGVGGPLGDELTAMAHQLARGVPVATAAAGLLAAATPLPPPRPVVALRRLVLGAPAAGAGQRALLAAVRALDRTEASGARLADTLRRIADRAREQAHAEAIAAARRAGVAAVVPLGLCFLPAFLLIGVVPAVVGILGGLLTA